MDPHAELLVKTARSLGIEVTDKSPQWHIDAIEFALGDHTELVLEGRHYSYLSSQSLALVDSKDVCKALLEECGLRVPADVVFQLEGGAVRETAETFIQEGQSYVCKPLWGTDGRGVAMHLLDAVDVEMHVDNWAEEYEEWILEEQIEGKDLRIQVIGGRIAAACIRVPAEVTGDGEKDLEGLIAAHNEKIAAQNPMNHLEIDTQTRRLMREQEVYLSTVIEAGQTIQLKYVSNMGKGGIARDITDSLHPAYQAIIDQVAEKFKLRTFAFDGIALDPTQHPDKNLVALELNAKAQWLHHTFSEVKTHDIAEMVLRDLFPELS